MKHHYVHDAWILLFLTIAIVLVSCGEDPKQEQERIDYAQALNERLEGLTIWAHGPGHKYVTFSTDVSGMVWETEKKKITTILTMPSYAHMIEIGFIKLYWSGIDGTIEFYADKKEKCWKPK